MGRLYSNNKVTPTPRQSISTTPKTGGRLYGKQAQQAKPKSSTTPTLDLMEIARKAGLGAEAKKITEPKEKLSTLGRLGAGLGAFNTAQPMHSEIERRKQSGKGLFQFTNPVPFFKEYGKNIAQGIGSAISGNKYEKDRKTYSDVAGQLGVENKILKGGIGFVGDVLLDPTTYFGGAIAKGATTTVKGVGNTGLKAVGKIAPGVEQGIRIAGQGAKDAFGKAFVYGYGTSKGLPQKALEIQSTLTKAKEGIVASNLARLGTGTLSKGQQEELVAKLLSGKRAEFEVGKATQAGKVAAKEAAQSTDPLVQKTIEAQTSRSQAIAKKAGIQDPYEIYFPGLKNDTVKKFVEGTKQLKVGSEGYLKQFKNLLTDDQLIRNPAEAFAKREFDVAKDSIIRSQLKNTIDDVGKPLTAFKTEEEALKAGYKLVKEKGMFGKGIGYLKEVDKKFLDNLISPEFTTIDAVAKATGFDALTSLFKRSVTGLFAPFHVRNYASGIMQNFEVVGKDALDPRIIAAGQKMAYKLAKGEKFADKIIKVAGKDVNIGKAITMFERRFGTSSSYIADIADATKGAGNLPGKIFSKGSAIETAKTLGLGQQAIPFRVARGIGNFIETQQKATAFLASLRQGKTIQQALTLAERAGFDYRALTGFESKILRRVIPFYSFTRKNIELQLRTLGENPQRINQILSTLHNVQEVGGGLTEDEKKNLPDYLKEGTYLVLGRNKAGQPLIAPGLSTPVEQPGQLIGSNPLLRLGSMLNPIFKAPLERATGKDFFYRTSVGGQTKGQDLESIVDAKQYSKAPNFIKDFLQLREVQSKNQDGSTKIKYTGNPYRLHILRNLPSSRGVGYLNQIFTDEQTRGTKTLNLLTGVKPRAIDVETVKYFQNRDNQRALEDLLIRAGIIKRFENTYVPKK